MIDIGGANDFSAAFRFCKLSAKGIEVCILSSVSDRCPVLADLVQALQMNEQLHPPHYRTSLT